MSVHMKPEEIETESFRTIDLEAGPHQWSPSEWPIVRRAVHTTADFEYIRTMFMSADAVSAGIKALLNGRGIVTDTTMALSGISRPRLGAFRVPASCFVSDPEVAAEAGVQGITRSIIAIRKGTADPKNGIFVIGNAPTALFELLRQVREEGLRPDLVVGLPVGFVGAAESKEELVDVASEYGIPFITNRGRKGGSNVAAAVMNALLIQALEQKVL
jgi:precorrin-8X/cobalt-precorrin-8 methylmutase